MVGGRGVDVPTNLKTGTVIEHIFACRALDRWRAVGGGEVGVGRWAVGGLVGGECASKWAGSKIEDDFFTYFGTLAPVIRRHLANLTGFADGVDAGSGNGDNCGVAWLRMMMRGTKNVAYVPIGCIIVRGHSCCNI